ncbi:hypothetical protein BK010_07340 [Tenericutes bacterium MO-XQ]|nr:hypothetical protein BK010_07340 [Tenericutes bacterium MO-XQ]
MNEKAGHTFLARLGKRRLRPGGVVGTNFLLQEFKNSSDKAILEVGCNMGTTAIELVKKYHIKNYVACDLDAKALKKAMLNAKTNKVGDFITFKEENALHLSFLDESFDIVINEAMLTMLSDPHKEKALKEYYRVLKPGGILLTHDVMLRTDDTAIQKEVIGNLSRAINIHAKPHTKEEWNNLFNSVGFHIKGTKLGPMSLLNPLGMIKDEGLINTLRMIKNARKPENKKQFDLMFQTFKKYQNELGFIATISIKK